MAEETTSITSREVLLYAAIVCLIIGCAVIYVTVKPSKRYTELEEEYSELSDEYYEIYANNLRLMFNKSFSLEPPYISVSNRTVYLFFKRMDGSINSWTIPFESLETETHEGYYARELAPDSIPEVECTNVYGKVFVGQDYRHFVNGWEWEDVIGVLYKESEGGSEEYPLEGELFIREVWNIVTQLSLNTPDIEETPRYPLETFLAGGGDCEDTSILFASLIRAAPVDWNISFVYTDSKTPSVPRKFDHVLVSVDTGVKKYFIDTTQHIEMEPLTNVTGCSFEVD